MWLRRSSTALPVRPLERRGAWKTTNKTISKLCKLFTYYNLIVFYLVFVSQLFTFSKRTRKKEEDFFVLLFWKYKFVTCVVVCVFLSIPVCIYVCMFVTACVCVLRDTWKKKLARLLEPNTSLCYHGYYVNVIIILSISILIILLLLLLIIFYLAAFVLLCQFYFFL